MRALTDTQAIIIIAVVALCTALVRFLPFILFRSEEKTPEIVKHLGSVLPFAVTGMLIVYCFKSVTPSQYPFGLPELLAAGLVVLLHLVKKNTLISIAAGTIFYMILVNAVFV